jgi:hypothetical protein
MPEEVTLGRVDRSVVRDPLAERYETLWDRSRLKRRERVARERLVRVPRSRESDCGANGKQVDDTY